MAAISRAKIKSLLEPGLNTIFGETYENYGNQYKEIYTVETTKRSFIEELKMGDFGLAEVVEDGAPFTFSTSAQQWNVYYNVKTVKMGFAITLEAQEDNLYAPLARKYTKSMARSMAYTKEILSMEPFIYGFTSYNSGDGVTLFSASHPTQSGYTNSNVLTVAADLSEESLEAAVHQIAGWRDEGGKMISAKVRKLIIPQQLDFTAKRILGNDMRPGTADNDINALVKMSSIPDGFRVNNFLTDVDAWFLLTDIPDGMKCFDRVAMQTSMDEDFHTDNILYKARARYVFGVSDPLSVFGTPGAG